MAASNDACRVTDINEYSSYSVSTTRINIADARTRADRNQQRERVSKRSRKR